MRDALPGLGLASFLKEPSPRGCSNCARDASTRQWAASPTPAWVNIRTCVLALHSPRMLELFTLLRLPMASSYVSLFSSGRAAELHLRPTPEKLIRPAPSRPPWGVSRGAVTVLTH
ncbi:unnamed protein product [Pleuronectes platessa]|uniref:Uncharacterized protein n=1 Tax=Pleuronectes platessa TaxID=8262 RepID=A0A9N7W040_PLEPL|nr:unnamed protein product [Pleuronectes platessa]